MERENAIQASAASPSHITGFFKIYETGSTGAGLNTARGALTNVRVNRDGNASVTIRINGKTSRAEVSQRVLATFQNELADSSVLVDHELAYPIGYGLGMSGAGAFSLTLALNEALGTNYEYEDCARIATEAEIASGTGLGDVTAQRFHGLMVGKPPYPSRSVQIIPSDKNTVVCAFFEPLSTSEIIHGKEWKERINRVGEECMQELVKDISVARFIELSRHFTFETGLASPDVRKVLEAVPQASMAMLGQTVFLLCENEAQGCAALEPFTKRLISAPLATEGAHVL